MSNTATASLYKQPKGLYLLFSTELWERFGFYTIQAILILYMTKGLHYSDHTANLLYASYSSLLYITPLIGGYLADRFFGFQRAILIGGALSMVGYLITAIPGEKFFFLGLSILMCANGLFKPNVSAIVGELYEANDPRRDGGFTLFYMGINIGALVPPLIAGVLALRYGWHAGFLLAAAGMIIAQITFAWGRKRLPLAGKIPKNSPLLQPGWAKHRFHLLFYVGFIIAVGLCIFAFQYPEQTTLLVEATAVILVVVIIAFMLREPAADQKRMIASVILTIISVGFWALYNQTFTSLTLFADRNMIQHAFGFPVNASTMQFFNPLFIIIFSPILSHLWIKLSRKQLNPGIPLKFALGVLFVTLGFLILPVIIHFFTQQGMIPAEWLAFSYLLQTIGELLLSPVGLAMITLLTPKHLVGLMMGVWFFAQAASFALGGTLANLAAVPDNIDKITSMHIYNHAFFLFGVMALGLTVISFALIPLLKRLIGSMVDDTAPEPR